MIDVGKIIAFEDGALDEQETLALFQELVNDGSAWSLQGSYGRMAQSLLMAGEITPAGEEDPCFDDGCEVIDAEPLEAGSAYLNQPCRTLEQAQADIAANDGGLSSLQTTDDGFDPFLTRHMGPQK